MNERPPAHRGWGWARLRSFADAAKGLRLVFTTQTNAKIHAMATLFVVTGGFFFGLAVTEWALVVLAIALVWTAEAVNTAIENLVDLVSPSRHPLAGKAKDAAAGAVLAAAIGAAIIGVCIFGPRIAGLLGWL
jgi:diacylglycerol kinase (ATP)